MKFLNLKELKISYDPESKKYQGFTPDMCDRFGTDAETFLGTCLDELTDVIDQADSFCQALHDFCFASERTGTETGTGADGGVQAAGTSDGGASGTDAGAGGNGAKMSQILAKRLATAEAKVRMLEEQRQAEVQERELSREKDRLRTNDIWLTQQAAGPVPKILPAERPYIAYLLDIVTQLGSDVHAYAVDDKTKLSPADVLRRLFEMRRGRFGVMFNETSAGDATKSTGYSNAQEARQVATRLAKEYQAKHGEKDFRKAFTTVLNADPDLKAAVAGTRIEGAAKDAEGNADMAAIIYGPGRAGR
jgi:hypothetical protein